MAFFLYRSFLSSFLGVKSHDWMAMSSSVFCRRVGQRHFIVASVHSSQLRRALSPSIARLVPAPVPWGKNIS